MISLRRAMKCRGETVAFREKFRKSFQTVGGVLAQRYCYSARYYGMALAPEKHGVFIQGGTLPRSESSMITQINPTAKHFGVFPSDFFVLSLRVPLGHDRAAANA